MEPVSAAASVVGLVAFAGQLIQGLAKVNSFVQEMKDSDDRIKNLTRESKYLAQTLTELKSVLTKLEQSSIIKNHTDWNPGASSIQSILEACKSDLDQWEHSHMPKEEGSGAKRMFRLVWNGSLRKAQDLQSKFAVHRSQINTSIATINTHLSYVSLEKMESVHGDVRHLTESNLKSSMASTKASAANSAFMFESLREELSSLSAAQVRHHKMQEETLSHFSSVSSSLKSLASLASSLQRRLATEEETLIKLGAWTSEADLPDHIRLNTLDSITDAGESKNAHHITSTTDSLREEAWSCRAIIGIDQALVDLPDGQVHCLFCWQNVSMCGYRAKGKHIVGHHNFAGCDQNTQYNSIEAVSEHLTRDHGFKSTSDEQTMSRFAVDSSAHYDIRHEALLGVPPVEEKSAQQLLLAWEMTSMLAKTPYLSIESQTLTTAPASFGQLNKGMELLAEKVFSASIATSFHELPRILLDAANLEQEFIIRFNRPFPKRWAPVPESLLAKSSQSYRYVLTSREARLALRPYLHGMMWPVKLLDHGDSCHMCKNSLRNRKSLEGRKVPIAANTSGLCDEHNDHISKKICPRSADRWLSLDPALRITETFAELRNYASAKDRVNLWMLDVLHKSDHLLAVLRCSLFIECNDSHLPPSPAFAKHDDSHALETEQSDWGRQWTADLLETFKRDLEPLAGRFLPSDSDGAVDSRDQNSGSMILPQINEEFLSGSENLWMLNR